MYIKGDEDIMERIEWEVVQGRVDFKCGLEFRSYTYETAILKSARCIKNGKITFDMILDSHNTDKKMIFTVNFDNNRRNEHISILFFSDGNIEVYEEKQGFSKQLASLVDREDIRNELSIIRNDNNSKRIGCNIIIGITGSVITILRNGVEILYMYKTTNYVAQINAHFEGEGFCSIKNFIVNNMKLTAFVVMEFSDQFNNIYTNVIKPTCEKQDILCIRVDEICLPGKIISDILEVIKEADIIIAEITPDNANVFFELGYAVAFEKQIIPLVDSSKRDRLPFDIFDIRTIFYENSEQGISLAIAKLSNFLMKIKDKTCGGSVYRSILLNESERI